MRGSTREQGDAARTRRAAVFGVVVALAVTLGLAQPAAAAEFTSAPVPTISGTSAVGSTLTVNPGTWSPTPTGGGYRWNRNGTAISGATASTYRLVAADAGTSITVTVTATRSGYTTTSRTSAARAIPAAAASPFTSAPTPTISGTSAVGSTLTVNPGTWSPSPTGGGYQWNRNGTAIGGATAATYRLVAADAGTSITATVTASRAGYTTTSRTSAARVIPGAPTPPPTTQPPTTPPPTTQPPSSTPFTSAPTPIISGTSAVGSTLTVNPGTWSPTPTGGGYRWNRNGSAISGATNSTYRLVAADAGTSITVTVTASRAGYTTTSRTSAARVIPGTTQPPTTPPPTTPPTTGPGFDALVHFDQYTRAALQGQDGWTASALPSVVADPLDANNQVLRMGGGGNEQAYRAIPAIANGSTGTLFFRFLRTGTVDASVGLTDVDAPADFAHARAYANTQNDDALRVRNGGAFTSVGTLARDVWQCVWIVADNQSDRLAIYSQGGPYATRTRLPAGAAQQFGFRQAVNGALDRFFTKNGPTGNGVLYLDDLAVDTGGENLTLPTGNPGDCAPGGTASPDALINPLPDPIASSLGIVVTELAQLPRSSTTPATQDQRLIRYNRITHLDEVPDGSGRLMVPDNNGTLYLVNKTTGQYSAYLDVRQRFVDNFHNSAGLGTGLGSAEFHPGFAQNGLFYTVHTEGGTALQQDAPDFPAFGNTAYHSVVTEWKATNPAANVFAGTQREIMRIPFPGQVHTVQQIAFNPTVGPGDPDYGKLYLLVGDGGSGVGNGNPQNLAMPHGKIFRIDPAGRNSANGEYGIPPDNPFLGRPGALPELYAVGMRDPHRISWDPGGDHTMYLGHIGEWQVESVYAVEPGDNFGWSVREGPFLANNRQIFPLPLDDAQFGFTYPVAAYDHNRDPGQTGDAGVALNGGFVYRGAIQALRGRYLFTDLVRGWVLSTNASQMVRNDGDIADLAPIERLRVFSGGRETTFAQLVGDTRVDLRFGSDADGELYLVAKANGKIWKVTGATTG
ncbi:PQQ-dependent sugar dehydrogenase [Agromyces protaetiae]|uniref:PQQ-dependent sugar dehydrogenase n=1 Tax=Agromyces protaetiae TaxID=2509455 RepID=UPI001FB80876|nr:PQQ-dependent sugar dehydrogenase [Agromyces protaetiae]